MEDDCFYEVLFFFTSVNVRYPATTPVPSYFHLFVRESFSPGLVCMCVCVYSSVSSSSSLTLSRVYSTGSPVPPAVGRSVNDTDTTTLVGLDGVKVHFY